MLLVQIGNEGEAPVRIWRHSNSWGAGSLQPQIEHPDDPTRFTELVPRPEIFTRDGPGLVELRQGEVHREVLRPGEPVWLNADAVAPWRLRALTVRIRLVIGPSAEAVAEGVFVGQVLGRPCRSAPPHPWIFG